MSRNLSALVLRGKSAQTPCLSPALKIMDFLLQEYLREGVCNLSIDEAVQVRTFVELKGARSRNFRQF